MDFVLSNNWRQARSLSFRFEDARPLIYKSAMNEMSRQEETRHKPKQEQYNPNPAPVPPQMPYNPFDEFSQNEFVQNGYDGSI